MPSGHAASDTAFAVAAYREMPSVLWPMVLLTTASHWSLVRSHSHYISDVLVGDAVGLVIAMLSTRLWPSPTASSPEVMPSP